MRINNVNLNDPNYVSGKKQSPAFGGLSIFEDLKSNRISMMLDDTLDGAITFFFVNHPIPLNNGISKNIMQASVLLKNSEGKMFKPNYSKAIRKAIVQALKHDIQKSLATPIAQKPRLLIIGDLIRKRTLNEMNMVAKKSDFSCIDGKLFNLKGSKENVAKEWTMFFGECSRKYLKQLGL